MKKIFSLKFKDELKASPLEIMEQNVHNLEKLCKKANNEGFQIVLYSPEKINEPKNIYELSIMLAEDMVKKYNENNIIIRNHEECKQLA